MVFVREESGVRKNLIYLLTCCVLARIPLVQARQTAFRGLGLVAFDRPRLYFVIFAGFTSIDRFKNGQDVFDRLPRLHKHDDVVIGGHLVCCFNLIVEWEMSGFQFFPALSAIGKIF